MDFWFNTEDLRPYQGVPFVIEQGIEAMFPIFALNTEHSEHIFATILPLSSKPVENVIEALKNMFQKYNGFNVTMDAMGGVDYLFDAPAIIQMLQWIKKVQA